MVCLGIFSCLFIFQAATEKRIRQNIRDTFQSSQAVFRQIQQLNRERTVDNINDISDSNAQLRSVLATVSVGTDTLGMETSNDHLPLLEDAHLRLKSILPFLSIHNTFDIFIITNAEGVMLYSKAAPERFGGDLSHLSIWGRLENRPFAEETWFPGLSSPIASFLPAGAGDAVFHIIAVPVFFNDAFYGLVICGQRIDKRTLLTIKGITGTDLALYLQNRVIATTLPHPIVQKGALDVLIPSNNNDSFVISDLAVGKERFLAMGFPIIPDERMPEGGFVALRSYSRAISFFIELRNMFFILAAVILLITLFFSFILAKGITRPVKQLADAASMIGKGNLNTHVTVKSGDEIEYLGDAFNDMIKGLKERDFIQQTFERYVSANVADEIIRNPDLLHLGGQKKEVTIFFTDIGNFSTLAEGLEAPQVVSLLNQYFQGMSEAILAHDGTINQFQGDAIFAFWGAPLDQPDHPLRACRAALACLSFLNQMESNWREKGLAPRTYRFGINTGEALVGNIGSTSRFEYTLIGDEVNLASRLESANKFYGTQILITEKTHTLVKDRIITREVDHIRVVGRSNPVRVYEPVCEIEKQDETVLKWVRRFEKGLAYYRNGRWQEALDWFNKTVTLRKEDGPSKVFVERCRTYEKNPPPGNWDGVTDLGEK